MKAIFAAPLKVLFILALASSAFFVAVRTLHWPMIGDSALMHYAVFLMERGASPYRDLAELNFPGAYWIEWSAMHLYGPGALGWRCFDLSLGLAAIAAMMIVTRPSRCFAGFWAGTLLLLLHARDGIFELGQRDLSLTVCLLLAYAALFTALRRKQPWLLFVFGLAAGLAATIKPTTLPIGPLALWLLALQERRQLHHRRMIASGIAGLVTPWLGVLFFLGRQHALKAFMTTTAAMISYHATLARRDLGYLLLHSISPLLPLLLIWILVLALNRRRPSREQLHLVAALALGLLSYLIQGKGYSYQRYPALAFLLLVMAIDFQAAWQTKQASSWLAVAGLAFGAFFLAPTSALLASRYDGHNLGTISMLEQDLETLGAPELAGGIQCVDSVDGCTNVLYRLRLKETSAVFYDEFLFGPQSDPAVRQNRDKFWRDLAHNPPEIIVVTDRLFPSGPNQYAKLARWPLLDDDLRQNYTLYLERTPTVLMNWWSRPEVPAGYRIYLKHPQHLPSPVTAPRVT